MPTTSVFPRFDFMLARRARAAIAVLLALVLAGCAREPAAEDGQPPTWRVVERDPADSRDPYPGGNFPLHTMDCGIETTILGRCETGTYRANRYCCGCTNYGATERTGPGPFNYDGWLFQCDEHHVLRRIVWVRADFDDGPCLAFDSTGRLRVAGLSVHKRSGGIRPPPVESPPTGPPCDAGAPHCDPPQRFARCISAEYVFSRPDPIDARKPYPLDWPVTEGPARRVAEDPCRVGPGVLVVEERGVGLRSYGALSAGRRSGPWVECDENHVARRIVHYVDGAESGLCLAFDSLGVRRAFGELAPRPGRVSVRTGRWEYRNADGSLDLEHSGEYVDDRRVTSGR